MRTQLTENTILVAEDDTHISEMLRDLLGRNGYAASAAYSGTEALLLLAQNEYSLVLLDLMLPGKMGDEVLREVRTKHSIPIIVLTAQADKETTARLLRMGADDYVTKPFDNDELLARIAVQLRRRAHTDSAQTAANLHFKDITLDAEGHDATIDGKKLGLSKREYELLRLMMTHPKKVFTKNNLYESVWGGEFLGDDNTINVHVSRLRAKLGRDYIQTVWGVGFKMSE